MKITIEDEESEVKLTLETNENSVLILDRFWERLLEPLLLASGFSEQAIKTFSKGDVT